MIFTLCTAQDSGCYQLTHGWSTQAARHLLLAALNGRVPSFLRGSIHPASPPPPLLLLPGALKSMSCLQSPCGGLIFGVNCCFSSFWPVAAAAPVVVAAATATAPPARSIVLHLEGGEAPPWAANWDVTEFNPLHPPPSTLTVSGGEHFHPHLSF